MINKLLFISITALTLLSCNHQDNKDKEYRVKKEKYSTTTDEKNIPIKEVVNRDSINKFIQSPFNLISFKKYKNGAHNSGIRLCKYHFHPSMEGVAYKFFSFGPKRTNQISRGKKIRRENLGYIGTSKKRTVIKQDGLVIKTFQPKNKYLHNYSNPTEILIEVTAKYNDFDLPELAFIGLDSLSIIKKLGKPDRLIRKFLIYENDSKVLILKISKNKVEWLKYIYTQQGVDIFKEDKIFGIK